MLYTCLTDLGKEYSFTCTLEYGIAFAQSRACPAIRMAVQSEYRKNAKTFSLSVTKPYSNSGELVGYAFSRNMRLGVGYGPEMRTKASARSFKRSYSLTVTMSFPWI